MFREAEGFDSYVSSSKCDLAQPLAGLKIPKNLLFAQLRGLSSAVEICAAIFELNLHSHMSN